MANEKKNGKSEFYFIFIFFILHDLFLIKYLG